MASEKKKNRLQCGQKLKKKIENGKLF